MKVIAVDYDNTYSDDPELFTAFIRLATERGHYVMCVTSRHPNDPRNAEVEQAFKGFEIIYASGKPKIEAVAEYGAPEVDIWIDDMPWTVFSPLSSDAEVL